MKFDPNNVTSLSVKRTLKALESTATELLISEPFDSITVKRLCEQAYVPRSTFYNYFEDKNDFLHYCLRLPADKARGYFADGLTAKALADTLVMCFKYVEKHGTSVESMMRVNRNSDALNTWMRFSFRQILTKAMEVSSSGIVLRADRHLTARMIAEIMELLLEQKLLNVRGFAVEDAVDFLLIAVNYDKLGIPVGTPDAPGS